VPRARARAHRQPCRKLHAVFAATNDKHCAHISFKPMADPKGNFKCQESAQVQALDLFTVDQVAKFESFVAEAGFEANQHWRLSPCQSSADCPSAGDPEEKIGPFTVQYNYTNSAMCSFGAAPGAERRLLFGARPQAGVCVPT
tara:strand:- start:155 stop:583 length:429 start_codon:yes stop_codon:yes gene_type:complete